MDDFFEGAKKAGKLVLDEGKEILREVENNHFDDAFYRGYDRASRVCIKHISHKVGTLRKQIKEGKYLSKEDQFLMVQLEDLQREIEEQLSKFRVNIRAKIVKKDSQ